MVVTAPGTGFADGQYDFISRYFWPANGGEEDPVTGSIHAALAPYWAAALGKTELLAWQASSRGGELRCVLRTGAGVGVRPGRTLFTRQVAVTAAC